jgi:hypothetical protein
MVPDGSIVSSGPFARRAGVELDRHCDANAAAAAAPACLRPAHRKTRPVPKFGRPPQRGRVVAAVIDETERIAVRHRFRLDEIAPPDLQAVEAVAAAGDVDNALEDKHNLRAPGAAVS